MNTPVVLKVVATILGSYAPLVMMRFIAWYTETWGNGVVNIPWTPLEVVAVFLGWMLTLWAIWHKC